MRWKQIKKELNITDKAVNTHLRVLTEKGLTQKGKNGYRLTAKGTLALEDIEAEGETYIIVFSKTLKQYYVKKFKQLRLHLDLSRGIITPAKTFATLGLYPLLALVKATVPSREAGVYDNFLAEVYVGAVDKKAKQKDGELIARGKMPILTGTLWKLASPKAHLDQEESLVGYTFNFPKAYNEALSQELKPLLAKAFPYVNSDEELQKAVFARLKVISHPVHERRGVVKEIWQLSH